MEKESVTKKTLVAVDGSEQSEEALNWYLDFLHREGDEVLLVHVSDPVEPAYGFRGGLALSEEQWAGMKQALAKKEKNLRDKFSNILRSRKVRFAYRHECGDVGYHLVEVSRSEKVDMIVTGTRGLGTVRRTILGSVSNYVLHHANVPCLIYRDGASGE